MYSESEKSVRHEKEGKMVFYGMMILEGLIAMIWAAAAMGLYNSGSTAGATAAVGEVAKELLGPIGGIVAILGVIFCRSHLVILHFDLAV